jgi:predicted anti-sigma-YlaC factor YlaD
MLNSIKKIFRRGEIDCDEVRERSSDYLEQDLPPAKQSALLAHLSKCGPCRAFVGTLSSTIGVLSRLPQVTASAAFKQSLLEQTTHEPGGKPP